MVLILGQTTIFNITLKIVLSEYNGNTAPENGLSINKYLIGVHGCFVGESSIVTLQFVNNFALSQCC